MQRVMAAKITRLAEKVVLFWQKAVLFSVLEV
jgi:hypothetical protein